MGSRYELKMHYDRSLDHRMGPWSGGTLLTLPWEEEYAIEQATNPWGEPNDQFNALWTINKVGEDYRYRSNVNINEQNLIWNPLYDHDHTVWRAGGQAGGCNLDVMYLQKL